MTKRSNFDSPHKFLFELGLEYAPSLPFDKEHLRHGDPEFDFHGENNLELLRIVKGEREKVLKFNYSKFFSSDFLEDVRTNGLEEILGDFYGEEYSERLEALAPIFRFCGFDLSKLSNYQRPLKVLQIGCGPHLDSYNKPEYFLEGIELDKILRISGAEVTNLDITDVSHCYPNSDFIQGDWFNLEKLTQDKEFDIMFTSRMDPDFGKGGLSIEEKMKLLRITLKSLANNSSGPKIFYTHFSAMGSQFLFEGEDNLVRQVARQEGFEYLAMQGEYKSRIELFVNIE